MYDVHIVTTPHTVACGPACLQMLLKYYNKEVSIEKLIEDCNVKINGCSGKDLLQAGKLYELDMQAYKMDAEELINQDRPAIIWWKYSHWCIMCGQNNKKEVVICNPSLGRFGIDVGTFKSFYSGIAIFNGEPVTLPPQPEENEYEIAFKILLGQEDLNNI